MTKKKTDEVETEPKTEDEASATPEVAEDETTVEDGQVDDTTPETDTPATSAYAEALEKGYIGEQVGDKD